MRFSVQVWVFIFGYSYSGSEFWSVLRFRYVGSVLRFGYSCLGILVQVFRFRYSYSGSEFWSGIEEVQVCSISIEVWVFWLRYSSSGIHIQAQNFGQVLRFRY